MEGFLPTVKVAIENWINSRSIPTCQLKDLQKTQHPKACLKQRPGEGGWAQLRREGQKPVSSSLLADPEQASPRCFLIWKMAHGSQFIYLLNPPLSIFFSSCKMYFHFILPYGCGNPVPREGTKCPQDQVAPSDLGDLSESSNPLGL